MLMLLCVCMHTGVVHTDNESAQHFDAEKLFGWDLNLWSWNPLDFETDALPVEPPRPTIAWCVCVYCKCGVFDGLVAVQVVVVAWCV